MASDDFQAKRELLKNWKHPSKKHLQSSFTIPIKDFIPPNEQEEYTEKQLLMRAHKQAKEQSSGEVEVRKEVNTKHAKAKYERKRSEEWDERDQEKERIKQERHMKLADDFDNLRAYYKRLYIKALSQKIKFQKEKIQDASRRREEKERVQLEEEKKRCHQVKITRPKSQNVDNFDFLSNIEKTTYYKIIKIEQQLRRQGMLSKPHCRQLFWSYITKPKHLESILEKGEFTLEDIQSMNKEEWRNIEEEEEETSHSWALTGLQHSPNIQKSSGRTEKWVKVSWLKHGLATPSPLGRAGETQNEQKVPKNNKAVTRKMSRALTLEQKFPKVDFPPLAAYSIVFGEQEIDPEVLKEKELEEKRKQSRNDLVHCHNSMFLHALANKAATHRLMARNEDYNFDQLAEGPTINDLLGNCLDSSLMTKKALKPKETIATFHTLKQQFPKIKTSNKIRENKKRKETSKQVSDFEFLSPDVSHEEIQNDQSPMPLTLSGVLDKCVIKEAKGLSTLWVNPLQ